MKHNCHGYVRPPVDTLRPTLLTYFLISAKPRHWQPPFASLIDDERIKTHFKRSHSDSSVLLIHKKLTPFTHKLSNNLIQHPYSTNHSVSLFHNKYRTWNRKIQTQQFLYCYSRKSDENCFCCGYLLYTITWGNFAEALWWVLMATHLWKKHILLWHWTFLASLFLWHHIANQPEHTHTFLFYWVFCE